MFPRDIFPIQSYTVGWGWGGRGKLQKTIYLRKNNIRFFVLIQRAFQLFKIWLNTDSYPQESFPPLQYLPTECISYLSTESHCCQPPIRQRHKSDAQGFTMPPQKKRWHFHTTVMGFLVTPLCCDYFPDRRGWILSFRDKIKCNELLQSITQIFRACCFTKSAYIFIHRPSMSS